MSQKDFESDVSLDEKYILKNKSNPEANDDSIKQGVEVLSYSESQEELVQKGCLASKISTEVSSLLNIMDLSRKAEDQSQSS